MPKFIIERDIPGAAELTATELQSIAQQWCSVLREMGTQIQWVQSFVAGDRIYCIYVAPDAEMIREHARRSGFPAEKITRIETIIDPTTAERQGTKRETAFGSVAV